MDFLGVNNDAFWQKSIRMQKIIFICLLCSYYYFLATLSFTTIYMDFLVAFSMRSKLEPFDISKSWLHHHLTQSPRKQMKRSSSRQVFKLSGHRQMLHDVTSTFSLFVSLCNKNNVLQKTVEHLQCLKGLVKMVKRFVVLSSNLFDNLALY